MEKANNDVAPVVASPKETGGGGFVFEDKVAAYFLSYLLSGQPPLDPQFGSITRIDFQTRVDGWLLDDVLLTLASDGETRHCCFSVKSGQQFTADRAPSDFVRRAWMQFLHEGTAGFENDRDLLGLATAPLPATRRAQLDELLRWARLQDPKDLPQRVRSKGFGSAAKRKLLASFSCPPELADKHGVTDAAIGEVLRCVVVLEFDFEQSPSTRLQEAIEKCRSVLVSGSLQEAQSLWEALLAIAADYRPNSGYLDLCRLADLLRSRFRLKDFPRHEADWARLLAQSKQTLEVVADKIGGKVVIPREAEMGALDAAFSKSRVVVLLGPSGCGKTVVAKWWAAKVFASARVLWWSARDFDVESLAGFEHSLGLEHSLCDPLQAATVPGGYLVIDGLDRIFSEIAFRNLSAVVHALRLDAEASPWHVLVTCQPEEWSRVQMELARVNVLPAEWRIVEVRDLDASQLEPVWDAFPALRRLSWQPHLQRLVLKPKVLDLLASRLAVGGAADTDKWVGESDLIQWFWETEVCSGPKATARAGFVLSLAEKQADNLASATPISEFAPADLAEVDGMIQDRLCERRDELLSFSHDLYGDWARQRILVSKAANLRQYIEPRISSPLWHRALRLYGLQLLERSADTKEWRAAFDALGSGDQGSSIAQDLLLESAIFAADPLQILERLWPDLQADGGALLRRLLRRFLHVATLPNPLMQQIARMLGAGYETEAATIQRIPYSPYWIPMIRFLHNHLADATALARAQVAEIADTWLRRGSATWPLRREAAELGITVAEWMLRFKHSPGIAVVEDEVDEIAYRAGLAAAQELPDRVVRFALEASQRRQPNGETPQAGAPYGAVVRRIRVSSPLGAYEAELPPPWPDGPTERVDEAFQKTCLDGDALQPMIVSNPNVAREVLLALLIEEPRAPDRYGHRFLLEEDLSIERVFSWYPPFYTRGPFLPFLVSQSAEGLELILRLVNFATDRWADGWRARSLKPPSILVTLPDGEREYLGDGDVYFWYRDLGRAPHAVVSALMALERWLYVQMDEKRPLADAISLLLAESNSLAIVGLLAAVGKKEPSLFLHELLPLLGVAEFHHWETAHQIGGEGHQMIGWTLRHSEAEVPLAHEWNTLPHRTVDFSTLAQYLYLNHPDVRSFLDQARAGWQARLAATDSDDESPAYLERLVAVFDTSNWQTREDPQHGAVWAFEAPAALREKNEPILQQIAGRQLLFSLPLRCREILNASEPLATDAVEELWNAAQRVAQFGPLDTSDAQAVDIEDAICGVAAVLLKLQRDWLKQHPEREEWCAAQLVRTVQNPPKPKDIDSDVSASDWHWDSFCAQVIPLLWAEDPDSPTLRECVALLTMSHHYRTVAILFGSAANVRDRLGEEFRRLQHFVLRWAALRWERTCPGYQIEPEKHVADFEARVRKEVQAFVVKSIPAELPRWVEVMAKETEPDPLSALLGTKRTFAGPGLDLQVVQAAYAWLPALDQARTEAERADWLNFWREALACSLRMLGEGTEDDGEISGMPYPWDGWVFSGVARVIAKCRPGEHPEEFWKQVLDLGLPAHRWVEEFLRQWFLTCLGIAPLPEGFVRQWRAMLEFAFSSPQWNFESEKRYWDLEEMWRLLVGFDSLVSRVWVTAHQPLVTQMRDMYQRWVERNLTRPRSAVAFMTFLEQPAASDILLDGLIWLEQATMEAGEHFWTERYVKETMASLLDSCWRSHRADLSSHEKGFKAFNSLLRRLADYQNPIALELLDRITKEV